MKKDVEICCLGIESTAHTFGAAVIKNKKVISNVKKAFVSQKGGMIPYEVADHHVSYCDEVINTALIQANVSLKEIRLISFSMSPGIGPMLRIGAMCARSLSAIHNIPLIGVNHCIAHLEIGSLLTNAKDPVLLYASGANTQIIAYDQQKYRVFGETLDMGIGNFLDQIGREFGLGFPAGAKIGELAKQWREKNKESGYIELPYVVKGMDVSFGGIYTKVKTLFSNKEYPVEQLCFSIEETVYAMLLEITERALSYTEKKELILGGGVACANRLQEMTKAMCKERGITCHILENQFNVDNAAMIAWLGILSYSAGNETPLNKAQIDPYVRTDDVFVNWKH